jgi:hypothetical protein
MTPPTAAASWPPETLREAYDLAARCEVSWPLGHVLRWHAERINALRAQLAQLDPVSTFAPERLDHPQAAELHARSLAHHEALAHFTGKARSLRARPMEQPLEQFIERLAFAVDLLAEKLRSCAIGDDHDDALVAPVVDRARALLDEVAQGLASISYEVPDAT